MPAPDASVRNTSSRDPSEPSPLAARAAWWPVAAGAVLIVAGLLLWRDPALNTRLFHVANDLGPDAPVFWSCLCVAGLALSAFIYVSAFAQQRPERVARLLWVVVVGGVVINQIKHRMPTPRPLLGLGDGHLTVIGEVLKIGSMPSGHSAMAFAVLTLMLADLRERAAGAPAARRGSFVAARAGWTLLALGIVLSRLAVGAHWPADALFGAGLGLLFAGLAPRAWPVAALTRWLGTPGGRRAMAIGLVVAALSIAATPAVFAALGLGGSRLEKQLSTGYPLAEPLQWALALLALVGAWRWWRAAGTPATGAR